MKLKEISTKKIAVWGIGAEGLSIIRLFISKFPAADLSVLSETPVKNTIMTEISSHVNFIITKDKNLSTLLCSFDIVFKSPGISKYQSAIETARQHGVIFSSATQLWFDENPGKRTICVTGTKGKSTVTHLIAALLQSAGKKVVLAGNMGIPLTEIIDSNNTDYFIFELSSFQTADLKATPTIAVLLNLHEEHLDWHQSRTNYFNDKLNLFNNVTDACILNAKDPFINALDFTWHNPVFFNSDEGIHIRDSHFYLKRKMLFSTTGISLLGQHNMSNICAALSVLNYLEIDLDDGIKSELAKFTPLPHRLSVTGEINGVIYINDSISTIPESAIAALQSLPDKKVTILLGGYDRQIDFSTIADHLANNLSSNVTNIITISASGKRLFDMITHIKSPETPPVYHVNNLRESVDLAKKLVKSDEVVLLSPASPSFDEFNSFSERGEAFQRYVALPE